MAAQQKPHSPAGGCEAVAVLLCNNTPHSSFMAVPEMANVPCMCVHVTWRCYISCQRRLSTELQTSDRTRPGGAPGAWKKGAGPNPHPGTATYNRQIWSSALQHPSEALSLPPLSLTRPVFGVFFTQWNWTGGGLFLAEAQLSLPSHCCRQPRKKRTLDLPVVKGPSCMTFRKQISQPRSHRLPALSPIKPSNTFSETAWK